MDQIFPFISIFTTAIAYGLAFILIGACFGMGAALGSKVVRYVCPDPKR